MVRIHTFSLKGGEKRGQPNYGSRNWEVTLTGELDEGETVKAAARDLKKGVQEGLDLAWTTDVEVQVAPAKPPATPLPAPPVIPDPATARHRMSGAQRKELQELLGKTPPEGRRTPEMAAAIKAAMNLVYADEADPAIMTLRTLIYGRK